MSRKDILIGLVIGEVLAWLALPILKNIKLDFSLLGASLASPWLLPIVLPFLSLAGLWLANFLGRRFDKLTAGKSLIIWQAAKFGLVGALNTLLDLGVLNLLILVSGIASGFGYSVFKGISFFAAVVNSYFWNKFWTFKKTNQSGAKEFAQFTIVSLIGFGVNVGTASLIVNVIGQQFGITEKIWANIGAMTATFVAMVWNFAGYKLFVFKSNIKNQNAK